jgi:hypothetical protein
MNHEQNRQGTQRTHKALVLIESAQAKSQFSHMKEMFGRLIGTAKSYVHDVYFKEVSQPEPLEGVSAVITDNKDFAQAISSGKENVPVIFVSGNADDAPKSNLVEMVSAPEKGDSSKYRLFDTLMDACLLYDELSRQAPARIKQRIHTMEAPSEMKFRKLREEYVNIRDRDDILISGHCFFLADLVSKYTEERLSGNKENTDQLYAQALDYARKNGVIDYVIAKSHTGPLRRLGGGFDSRSEMGEGGAKGMAWGVLKPVTGKDHTDETEKRYGLFLEMLNAPRHKPLIHKAPLHDTEKQASLLLIEMKTGPDLIEVFKQLTEAEVDFTEYYSKQNAHSADLADFADILRVKYQLDPQSAGHPLSTAELDHINKIHDATDNVTRAAIKDYAYWAGFWHSKSEQYKKSIPLPNGAQLMIDSSDNVRQDYVKRLGEIPQRFSGLLKEQFSAEELGTFSESISALMKLVDWSEEFIVPYRDTDFRNVRMLMETSKPRFKPLLEHCLDEEKLSQSLWHYDFGTRSCHVLEDLYHMAVTPEARILPEDHQKQKMVLDAMVKGLKEHYPEFSNSFREAFLNKETVSPQVMAFYRCARKMELTTWYSHETHQMFELGESEKPELDASLLRQQTMFHQYNDLACKYLNTIVERLSKAKSTDKKQGARDAHDKYTNIFKVMPEQGLAKEHATELSTIVLHDPALSDEAKQTACALYVSAFLQKLKKNFRGYSA